LVIYIKTEIWGSYGEKIKKKTKKVIYKKMKKASKSKDLLIF
jgi:hypothetical protein